MALKDVGVKLVIEGTGVFKTKMGGAQQQIKGLGGTIMKHNKAIGAGMTAMGASILAGSGMAVKSFVEFSGAMREVNTMMGLNQKEFDALGQDVRNLSSDLGVDAVQSAKALYQAISAGVPKENVIDFMAIASKAAIGGVTDTETAVDGLTTVINAFKIPLTDTQKIADIMFTTVKGGKTTFEELSASLFQVAPISAAAGIRFEEVSAALATMTKQGVPTSVATTQLRQAIVMLQKPTADMNKVIKELGFESGQTMLKELGLVDTLNKLRNATGGNNEMLMAMFGSVEAGGAVLALTGENAKTFANDLNAMENATGAATAAFEEMNKGAGRQWAQMQAKFKEIALMIGENLLPVLRPIIDTVGKIIGKIGEWTKKNPALTKVIVIVVAALGGLMAVLGPILIMLPGILHFLPMLGVAFAFLTGPVGLAIAAIAALIAIGFLVKKNWQSIADFMKRLWEGLKMAAINIFKGIATVVLAPLVGVLKVIRQIASAMVNLPGVGGLAQTVLGAVNKALGAIGGISFLAGGGVAPGGPAVVGERGPELVSLPPGAIVRPITHETNFNVEANYTNPQEPQGIGMDLAALLMLMRS